jgi:hypothetical protein
MVTYEIHHCQKFLITEKQRNSLEKLSELEMNHVYNAMSRISKAASIRFLVINNSCGS